MTTRTATKHPKVSHAKRPNHTKITISLPPEQVAQAHAAVQRGEAPSVSGYISAALAAVAPVLKSEPEEDSLADLVADLIAEHGPPSPEDYAWADRVLAMSEPD
jgi:hypothetical protein